MAVPHSPRQRAAEGKADEKDAVNMDAGRLCGPQILADYLHFIAQVLFFRSTSSRIPRMTARKIA